MLVMLVLINLLLSLSYRIPLIVKEIKILGSSGEFAACPKCKETVDREYMSFCDRCGQHLDWSCYDHAVVIPTFAQQKQKAAQEVKEPASIE